MPKDKTDRPLRADAERNRAAVLGAAEQLLGTQGPSLTTEEVARRASVGVGTVFRHFGSKEQLLVAVVAARVSRLTESARAIAMDDNGDSLVAFFERVVEHTATTPAIMHALSALDFDVDEALEEPRRKFLDALDDLVRRGQGAALIRDDVDVVTVFDLLVATVRGAEASGRDRERVHRVLAIIVDGLRPRTFQP